MKNYPHKKFFREPTEAQIRRECTLVEVDPRNPGLVEIILGLGEGEGIVLTKPMYPDRVRGREGWKWVRNSRDFFKHAPVVQPGTVDKVMHGVGQALRRRQKPSTPLDYRRETFDQLAHRFWGGYMFRPFPPGINGDNRVRRVSLADSIMNGSKLYAYAHQVIQVPEIEVGDYTNTRQVGKVGAVVPVTMPSRRQKVGRYRFRLTSVPVVRNDFKFRIGWNLGSEGHDCERKRWHFRYKGGSPATEQVFCAHERAAYRFFADHMWQQPRSHTPTPYVMNQFVEPTQLMIDLHRRTLDSVLVQDPNLNGGTGGLRTTNMADEEIILWATVVAHGHDATCFREKGGPKLKDEDWSLRYTNSKR